MFPFIQEYCCKESDIDRHTTTGAKIHAVLRNWNRSEDGNVFQFLFLSLYAAEHYFECFS